MNRLADQQIWLKNVSRLWIQCTISTNLCFSEFAYYFVLTVDSILHYSWFFCKELLQNVACYSSKLLWKPATWVHWWKACWQYTMIVNILDKLWQTDKLLMGACLNFRSCILYSASIDILADESLVTQSTLDQHVTDCSSDINWESTASPPIYTNDCQSMNIHWHIIDILLTLDQLLLADWYISHHSIECRHIPINMLVITWLTVDRHATDVPFNYHIDR